jgi:hypothetical protein
MSHRKYSGFSRSAVKATGENWDEIRECNLVLRRLEDRLVSAIKVEGPFAESKIAWKAAVLRQVLLHRMVELGGGCADMWNTGNVLCSVLAARALLETVAVFAEFQNKTIKHFKESDFKALDELLDNLTFSTRDPNAVKIMPELEAKNVLTYIDRLKKILPPIREHYDRLSEWCHPNGYGHYFTFASLDPRTGTVSFSRESRLATGLFKRLFTVYLLLGLVENAMSRLDVLIVKLAETHSKASPVSRPSGE